MKVSFYAPSYKRPEKSSTQILYPFVKLVVRESESDEYRRARNDIVVVPDSAQGNVSRIRNYIVRNLMGDSDALVIVDDDNQGFFRWEEQRKVKLEGEALIEFCEEMSILCRDFGFKLWGMNCVPDKGAYREHTPFGTLSFLGSPFHCHLKDTEIFYDEDLPLKEDYDITLQHIHYYGGCLRANFAFYVNKQSEQPGGCGTYRNLDREKEQFYQLQRKWGSKVVRMDKGSKRSFDYNPIIKVPIKGV